MLLLRLLSIAPRNRVRDHLPDGSVVDRANQDGEHRERSVNVYGVN